MARDFISKKITSIEPLNPKQALVNYVMTIPEDKVEMALKAAKAAMEIRGEYEAPREPLPDYQRKKQYITGMENALLNKINSPTESAAGVAACVEVLLELWEKYPFLWRDDELKK